MGVGVTKFKAKPEEVNVILRQEHGLIAPAAEILGVSRTVLQAYIRRHTTCMATLKEAREGLCDKAEQKLFELVEAKDYRAIAFVLTTLGKDRGYIPPRGTPLDQSTNNVMMIGEVKIMAVPAGKFVMGTEAPELHGSNQPALTVIEGGQE